MTFGLLLIRASRLSVVKQKFSLAFIDHPVDRWTQRSNRDIMYKSHLRTCGDFLPSRARKLLSDLLDYQRDGRTRQGRAHTGKLARVTSCLRRCQRNVHKQTLGFQPKRTCIMLAQIQFRIA